MHRRVLRNCLMVILGLIFAVPAVAQIKPLTEEQVQGLVHEGHGNETGARLIALRGIDFSPSDDFIQSLGSQGASDAFLQSLNLAKRLQAGGGGGGAKKPLTEIQVFSLVSGEVPNQRVAMLARERGIDFDPTSEFLRQLRLAGGDDDLEDALKHSQVTRSEKPGPIVMARQTEVRQHMMRAAQCLNQKDYAQAESEYRAAIQLAPQDSDLHVGLGMALGREGNVEGQIAEDREAVRLNPYNDRAHLNLGLALARSNDQEGATAEYREALRLNPDNVGAHISMGIRLSQMGDDNGAIAEYSEAVRLYPNNFAAHYSLGMAYEHQGNRQAALREYRIAYDHNPNIPVYREAYERLSGQ
jgi:Flp pilus assembly protein TadD